MVILHYAVQFLVTMVATVAFSLLFHVPRRHYAACGITGAVGWLVYVLCRDLLALTAPAAVLIATLPLTACARGFALRQKAPITVFLLSGIFPLVPGSGIYYTAYYFLRGFSSLSAATGIETLKTALALSLGIALVCSVPLPKRK